VGRSDVRRAGNRGAAAGPGSGAGRTCWGWAG